MDMDYARSVLKTEAEAIASLIPRIDAGFADAVKAILQCKGRVVVSGMGKAGIIGQKISATFSSTGTPSFSLPPAEACHGDLGMVVKDDVVLCLSNSGETEELVRLLPHLRKIGAKVISITSRERSALAAQSDIVIDIGVIDEACPLGLAPSASTTAILAVGDALALTVLKERGLGKEDYARYHPGGELGRKLMRVEEVMRRGEKNPVVEETATIEHALVAITRARAGAVSVVDKKGKLKGIFTDGDLRRNIRGEIDLSRQAVGSVMTQSPVTIVQGRLAAEAIAILREKKIDELPVVDADGKPVGMLDIQDLLDVGLI
ncbi:MAG: hypothetical protein A2Z34_09105 [Planctomycetes bacterium RBG_16_59_8]|nr:MAG: hypothetical protein A2Z34_09105 [Planctomycetes bacterium RBG_16_59_8]